MSPDHCARGGATVGVLNRMAAWEANLVLNLRLWCDGPRGQEQVWTEFRRALPAAEARRSCQTFEMLVQTVINQAHRPLVRHAVGCACVGADEAVFLQLVTIAADGHLTDAALMATLLVGPSQAEHVALLAGEVGDCARRIHAGVPGERPVVAGNVVRLH